MKNCNEMVNSLLERREQYETEKKQKRKMLTRTLTPICCFCLVVIFGFVAWQGGMFEAQPIQTANDALYSGIKDNFDEINGENPGNPKANNRIVINRIDGFSADRASICLLVDDFVEMNKAELNAYYGLDVFPSVPNDIVEWDDQIFGVYRRNGGTGEVYSDQTVLNYSNDDFTRSINIELQTGAVPCLDYFFDIASEEKSMINNLEVYIGLSENGYYFASFLYQNVGFCVNANGLTQDEFVEVLSSIIK